MIEAPPVKLVTGLGVIQSPHLDKSCVAIPLPGTNAAAPANVLRKKSRRFMILLLFV
jgi:hypothetical protein